MKVLLHGRLAEALGAKLELETSPDASVADIRNRLSTLYPHISEVLRDGRARACVGDRLVGDDHRPATSDTLEFLPPVSGG